MSPRRAGLFALALSASLWGCGPGNSNNEGCAAACPEGLVCDPASGSCVPEDPLPEGCATDAQCQAPTPRCADDGTCVQCLGDPDCESGSCAEGTCLPVPERCGVARVVELSETPVVIEGTTLGRANDATPACAVGEGAPDLVYELVVKKSARLYARAVPATGGPLMPVLELRSACGGTSSSERLACAWADTAEAGALVIRDVEAGHYFLWVDADSATSGAFTLELAAVTPADGDSCLTPRRLNVAPGAPLTVEGDTRDLSDDGRGTCGGVGPEEIYELVLETTQRVKITATPTSQNFRPVLYLRRPDRCAEPDGAHQLDCGGVRSQTLTAQLDLPSLEPGTYYLFVDGDYDAAFLPTSGSYALAVEALPPLVLADNDRCESALAVALPSEGRVDLTGDTASSLSDGSSACGGTGPDVVYAFTLPAPRSVTVRAVPDQNVAYAPVLYLRSACESDAAEDLFACNAATQYGGAATLTVGTLPAGTWYLWVDGSFQSRGKFSLQIETAAPLPAPANDSCAAPAPVQPSWGTLTLSGTTHGASDDHSACEVPTGAPSPDVVYELQLAAASSLAVEVQSATGSSLQPVISLNQGVCAPPDDEAVLFCAWGDPYLAGKVAYTKGALVPGSYFLWVDGDLTSSGAFTLKARLGPPVAPPPNDACANATALSNASASLTGDTRSAKDDAWGYCQPWLTGSGEGAGDVAYAFTLETQKSVTVTVTPDATDGDLFRPAVYVRGPGDHACQAADATVQRGCAVAPGMGSAAVLSLPNLAPGLYYVWVDGVSQTSGKFTLTLQ